MHVVFHGGGLSSGFPLHGGGVSSSFSLCCKKAQKQGEHSHIGGCVGSLRVFIDTVNPVMILSLLFLPQLRQLTRPLPFHQLTQTDMPPVRH